MIQTETLQIVIGIPKTIGDTLSAEQGIQVYPLVLKQPTTGLTLDNENLWQPGRPALKNGGQWNNSSLVDGRTLSNDVVENVIETIQLIATAQDMRGLATLLAALQRFVVRARQFSATNWQIEPVYLEWAALGGYGSQYALIYDIQMDVSYDKPATPQTARITLVIEREPAWRGLPPGVSPRAWTKYWQGKIPGKEWDYTNIAFSDSGALFEATINNRTEFASGTDDYDYPSVSKNWAAIPAEDIPGDAPALAAVTVDVSQYNAAALAGLTTYVALSSKPHTLPQRGTTARTRQRVYQLNFGDSNTGTLTKTTDNTDGVKTAGVATLQTGVTAAGATSGTAFLPDFSSSKKLSLSMQRGKYAAFLRGKASTTTDQATVQLQIYDSDTLQELPEALLEFRSLPQALYIGSFSIPGSANAVQSSEGTGLLINSNDALTSTIELLFTLQFSLESGQSAISFIDLIFIPIDESVATVQIENSAISGTVDVDYLTIDSTGYAARTKGSALIMTGTNPPLGSELKGTDLYLQPGVDNHLILMITSLLGISGLARDDFPVKVDLVPRWYGVRDA